MAAPGEGRPRREDPGAASRDPHCQGDAKDGSTAGDAAQDLALLGLAERINAAHDQALHAARTSIERAVECGTLLLQAKASVGHGDWLGWLENNCTVRPRTAQVYMKLARDLPALSEEKAQRVAHLTVREAVHSISQSTARITALPAPQQDELLDRAEANGERLVEAQHHVRRAAALEAAFPKPTGQPAQFNGNRRKRLLQDSKTRRFKLVIGPNSAGLHVNQLVSALEATEGYRDKQNEIDDLTRAAEEFERQAAELRRQANRRSKDLKAWVTAEIVEQHGPIYPFIETAEYSIDDATFARLTRAASEQEAIAALIEASLVPQRRGYLGDIRHTRFDWPKPATEWTGIGNEHGLPPEVVASIAPPPFADPLENLGADRWEGAP